MKLPNIHDIKKTDILELIAKALEANATHINEFVTLEEFLDKGFCTYGENFAKRLEIYGCTELKDDKLILNRWQKEFASGIGDLRLYHVLTTGNAQCGKSLINTLLMVDFLVFVGVNVLWFYPTKTQVDNLVPGMFGRVVKSYVANVEEYYLNMQNKQLNLIGKTDRTSNSNFQVRGATAYFRYASTSGKDHTDQKKGLAVVGGSASSISANMLFIDERSQIQPEAIGTLFRRLDAARIPGGLIREIGTPGGGLGIEAVVEESHRHFYPHIICPHCKNLIAIDSKGCLFKPDPTNSKRFFNNAGFPVDWHYKDPKDKIQTAFFACSKCRGELAQEDRLNAHFRCLKTGQSWQSFKDTLPDNTNDALKNRYVVAFHLSPLLRQAKFDLAVSIVRTACGFENTSPRDVQQQLLGHKSESDVFAITKEMLTSAMQKAHPNEAPTCIVAGVDQGRGSDYMCVMQVWIPGFKRINGKLYYESDPNMSPLMCLQQAHKKVVFMSPVPRSAIPGILSNYKVDFGIVDNEPDIREMATIASRTCLELADQKVTLLDISKEITIFGASMEIPAYGINTDYFKDQVLNSYVEGKISIFEFDVNDKSINSIAKQMCAVQKDPLTFKWERPNDYNDDLFFASHFAESALHIYVDKVITETVDSVAWFNRIKNLPDF